MRGVESVAYFLTSFFSLSPSCILSSLSPSHFHSFFLFVCSFSFFLSFLLSSKKLFGIVEICSNDVFETFSWLLPNFFYPNLEYSVNVNFSSSIRHSIKVQICTRTIHVAPVKAHFAPFRVQFPRQGMQRKQVQVSTPEGYMYNYGCKPRRCKFAPQRCKFLLIATLYGCRLLWVQYFTL